NQLRKRGQYRRLCEGRRCHDRPGSSIGIRDWGFGIRDSGLGIRDSGFGIRDQGFGIRDQGFGIRDWVMQKSVNSGIC
ncbi:MAG TPA: hypothetical protein VKZ54_04355, partial [Membranihabitans sp.]|nr:hypothetical protein [Membranihabitans sp.]